MQQTSTTPPHFSCFSVLALINFHVEQQRRQQKRLSNLLFRFCGSFCCRFFFIFICFPYAYAFHFVSHFHFRCVTLHAIPRPSIHAWTAISACLWAEGRVRDKKWERERENARNKKYFVWQAGGKEKPLMEATQSEQEKEKVRAIAIQIAKVNWGLHIKCG